VAYFHQALNFKETKRKEKEVPPHSKGKGGKWEMEMRPGLRNRHVLFLTASGLRLALVVPLRFA
jgi:hypothetical protein